MAAFLKSIFSSTADSKDELLSKFKKNPKPKHIPSPLNLRLGGVVEFDRLPFRAIKDELQVIIPESAMIIVAYGSMDLGDGVTAHRFYDAEGQMLEVVTQESKDIKEVRFFVPFDSVYPASEEEWDFWLGDDGLIGYPSFKTKDGIEYLRLWFQSTCERVEPVELEENIIVRDFEKESICVEYQCMSYGRYIGKTDKVEYLQLSFEDTGNDASIELMLGLDMQKEDFQII